MGDSILGMTPSDIQAVRNSGYTPALEVNSVGKLAVLPFPFKDEDLCNTPPPSHYDGIVDLAPRQGIKRDFAGSKELTEIKLREMIKSQDERVCAWGEFRYLDIFDSKTVHKTEFCYQIIPEPKTGVFRAVSWRDSNRME